MRFIQGFRIILVTLALLFVLTYRLRLRVSTPTSAVSVSTPKPQEDFRICRTPHIRDLRRNDTDLEGPHVMPIWYQCEGPDYTQFGSDLRAYAQALASNRSSSSRADGDGDDASIWWGRRPAALPANTHILFFGNSHLRQTALSFVCQYGADVTDLQRFETSEPNAFMVTRVTFSNGAVVWIVANSYAINTPIWQMLLERQMQNITLNAMDAVVMGHHNDCEGLTKQYYQGATAIRTNATLSQMDCTRYVNPNVQQLLRVYNGTLLYVSPFYAGIKVQETQLAHTQIQEAWSAGKHNVGFINGRRHVNAMHHEGAAAVRLQVNSCQRANAQNHRCMGAFGGHPDLMAWDVQAWLFDHLPTSTSKV